MRLSEALLLLLFAGFGLACAFGATEPALSLQKDYLGPTGYPRAVGFALAALSIGALPWCLRRVPAADSRAPAGIPGRVLPPMLLALAYVAGIICLGFGVSTFFYLWFMPAFLHGGPGRFRQPANLLYAAAMTGLIELFFHIFKIYQPTALLF